MKRFSCTSVLTLLALSTMAHATQYYMISSDSNNCKVHWHNTKKGFVYVTGSDCLCAKKNDAKTIQEWDVNIDTKVSGCFPVADFAKYANRPHVAIKACDPGDHCNQYDCLKSYFYDGTSYSTQQVVLNKAQCVGPNKQPLDFCDDHGDNCTNQASS